MRTNVSLAITKFFGASLTITKFYCLIYYPHDIKKDQLHQPAVHNFHVLVDPAAIHVIAPAQIKESEEEAEIEPAKSPEQLQAEAENSGWLSIWHEFTWWPPMVSFAC